MALYMYSLNRNSSASSQIPYVEVPRYVVGSLVAIHI
jgi:hypothetical protein